MHFWRDLHCCKIYGTSSITHFYATFAVLKAFFLQLGVTPKNQPSSVFFFKKPAYELAVYQYVHPIFGATNSPWCANYSLIWKTTNETTFTEVSSSFKKIFHMDDYLELCATLKRAIRKAHHSVRVLAKGAFTLTKIFNDIRVVLLTLNYQINPPTPKWRP